MTPDPRRDLVTRELVQAMPMLRAFLRHLGASWEQIEEAVQETAVWCCGNPERFEPGTSFGAWVRSVARFRLLSLWRDQGRADANLDPVLADAIPDEDWDRAGRGADRRAKALGGCIEALPAPARRLVDLTYREELDAAEVARRLRSSVAAIYTALSRLRRRLRACVDQRLEQA